VPQIVEALKNQPGFGKSVFDREIEDRLQKVEVSLRAVS
jgi:hypothetical protein